MKKAFERAVLWLIETEEEYVYYSNRIYTTDADLATERIKWSKEYAEYGQEYTVFVDEFETRSKQIVIAINKKGIIYYKKQVKHYNAKNYNDFIE